MKSPRFLIRGSVAVALVGLVLASATGQAGAGTPVACTVEMVPTEIFINAGDTTAPAGDLTTNYTGSWSIADAVGAWLSVNGAAPVFDGTVVRAESGSETFSFSTELLVAFLASILGEQPAYGEYDVRIELHHYVAVDPLLAPAGLTPPYDSNEMLCFGEFTVTWSESELPETGSDAAAMWAWAAALAGLGAASLLAASRRGIRFH